MWCYWTRKYYNEDPKDAKGNTLHILRMVIEDQGGASWEGSLPNETNHGTTDHWHDAAIAALLSMAQREAAEWGLEEVEAWNPSSAMLEGARRIKNDVQVVNRDQESIASLRWFPKHEGSIAESIDWIGNEKHGWC